MESRMRSKAQVRFGKRDGENHKRQQMKGVSVPTSRDYVVDLSEIPPPLDIEYTFSL